MITYIEKGRGLILAIKEAGHRLWHQDRVTYSTNDEAVQLIIDAYDPLPLAKTDAEKRLIEQFNEIMKELEAAYPEAEKRLFLKQESEARAYLADSSAAVPTLTIIASERGVAIIDQATRVITKADEYTSQIGTYIGRRQAREDSIKVATDWLVVEGINL
jgi:hypothetical protein